MGSQSFMDQNGDNFQAWENGYANTGTQTLTEISESGETVYVNLSAVDTATGEIPVLHRLVHGRQQHRPYHGRINEPGRLMKQTKVQVVKRLRPPIASDAPTVNAEIAKRWVS